MGKERRMNRCYHILAVDIAGRLIQVVSTCDKKQALALGATWQARSGGYGQMFLVSNGINPRELEPQKIPLLEEGTYAPLIKGVN